MDMISYSYANRNILARISKILQNGQSDYWNKKAKEVQTKIKEYLWDAKRHACYDRDRDNKVMATNYKLDKHPKSV
jgi:neutral trehalase